MNGFYGKTYRYKDKEIGVCNMLNDGQYMIGHIKPSGSLKREKIPLPLFRSIEEAQKALDEFAKARGLAEA